MLVKTVILISIHIEDVSKVWKITSKNEPSRAQIETLLTDVFGNASKIFDLKYVQFQQLKGPSKKYDYVVNGRYYYTVEVERLHLIEFDKQY